eukprot:scaffold221442_cov22-Tisochrysis_lutea.AAC.4
MRVVCARTQESSALRSCSLSGRVCHPGLVEERRIPAGAMHATCASECGIQKLKALAAEDCVLVWEVCLGISAGSTAAILIAEGASLHFLLNESGCGLESMSVNVRQSAAPGSPTHAATDKAAAGSSTSAQAAASPPSPLNNHAAGASSRCLCTSVPECAQHGVRAKHRVCVQPHTCIQQRMCAQHRMLRQAPCVRPSFEFVLVPVCAALRR